MDTAWHRADAEQRAHSAGHEMQITLSLTLPRDEDTIPVTRHIVHHALDEVGALPECIADIGVAQTEACANVVHHSGPGDQYEVRVDIDHEKCVIRVIDTGRGFDWQSLTQEGGSPADASAERGRGIQLMRALVDEVRFVSKPQAGTIVHLEKALAFYEGSPMTRSPARGRDSTSPAASG